MRPLTVKRSIRSASTLVMLLAVAAFADPSPTPGNPDTNASDQNYDTNQPNSIPGGLQKSKDATNRGLNKVDSGVHKMGRKTKRGAHKAKAKTEAGMDKAGDKTEGAVDAMTEPAKKPAY